MLEVGRALGAMLGAALGRLDSTVGAVLGSALSPVGFWLVVGADEPDGNDEGDAVTEGSPVGKGLGRALGRLDETEGVVLGAALSPVGC